MLDAAQDLSVETRAGHTRCRTRQIRSSRKREIMPTFPVRGPAQDPARQLSPRLLRRTEEAWQISSGRCALALAMLLVPRRDALCVSAKIRARKQLSLPSRR